MWYLPTFAILLALTGCGAAQHTTWDMERIIQATGETGLMPEQIAAHDDAEGRHLTPEQRAERERQAAQARREAELVERALTNSPDYTSALRRAAEANVDEMPQPSGGRRQPRNAQARAAAIAMEEAQLSERIEVRRRQRLEAQEQTARRLRIQQAVYECQARSAQIEAGYYNPRSFLNLEAAVAGAQARQACLSAYGLR